MGNLLSAAGLSRCGGICARPVPDREPSSNEALAPGQGANSRRVRASCMAKCTAHCRMQPSSGPHGRPVIRRRGTTMQRRRMPPLRSRTSSEQHFMSTATWHTLCLNPTDPNSPDLPASMPPIPYARDTIRLALQLVAIALVVGVPWLLYMRMLDAMTQSQESVSHAADMISTVSGVNRQLTDIDSA